MSAPRDYKAFLNLLSVLVPVDTRALKSDRSVGGYLALRVAADQYLHNGKFAFDIDFYRDEKADGGVSTRLMDEPTLDIARSWLVGAYVKATVERFMTNGALDLERIRIAMTHDELLRVKHGEKITLERAALNAISLMRGQIPSRKPEVYGPAQEFDLPALGMGH
jgi:hypothetical protein